MKVTDGDDGARESAESVVALARAFREGDPAATGEVRSRVRRILNYRGLRIPADDRQDLEQTVVLQLWQAVRSDAFAPQRFLGFVETVVARRCIDWLRTRKNEVSLEKLRESRDARSDPGADVLAREKTEIASAVFELLPSPCRQLIGLHFVEGKAYSEIASILGRSEGALRVQMHRCIKQARHVLAETIQQSDQDGSKDRLL